MSSSVTTAAYNFMRTYAKEIGDGATRFHPVLDRIKKKALSFGESYAYQLTTSNVQNVGTDAQAFAGTGSVKGVRFTVEPRIKYGGVLIDGASLARCGSAGAIVDLMKLNLDSGQEELLDSTSFDLFRDGTGVRGRRSGALINTNTIQLETVSDVINFPVGMKVGAAAAADGTTPRTGSAEVTAVDEELGQVTVDNAAGISGFIANDYLFRYSESAAALTCVEGFLSCIPQTPSSSFRGVNQTLDATRRAGSRLAATGDTKADIGRLSIKSYTAGKKVNSGVLNPMDLWDVSQDASVQQVHMEGGSADLGFDVLRVAVPGVGKIDLSVDPRCPLGKSWVGDMMTDSQPYLAHTDAIPHVLDADSLQALRHATSNALQARLAVMGNVCFPNPVAWGILYGIGD
jgi:hypothetical protein